MRNVALMRFMKSSDAYTEYNEMVDRPTFESEMDEFVDD